MSRRTKTINWLEGRIIRELSKRQEIPSSLSSVIRDSTSIFEQHNFDIAIINLLSKRQIIKSRNNDGMTIYKLVA